VKGDGETVGDVEAEKEKKAEDKKDTPA